MNKNLLEQMIKETFCAGWLMGFLSQENVVVSEDGIEFHINNDFQKYLDKAAVELESKYCEAME